MPEVIDKITGIVQKSKRRRAPSGKSPHNPVKAA